jgi:nucleoredoxin
MEALIGDSFVDGAGKSFHLKEVIKPGETKAVGLYFSAHWCGPCRKFTPTLAKFYTNSLKAKGLEIIFVSSDKHAKAFNEYAKEMPWKAIPFANRTLKNKLSAKFKVEGIPSLIILNTDGEIITENGRGAVMQDPTGDNFPWAPIPVLEILQSTKLVAKDGSKIAFSEAIEDTEVLGLYFSASWCPPCHAFTPVLSACYMSLKLKENPFEAIFVSLDRNEESFVKYHEEMPWPALEFANRQAKDALVERYKVEGIPTLIILNPKTGKVINDKGVPAVLSDKEGESFPWTAKPVELLNQYTASSLGASPAVFIFCNDNAEKAKNLQADISEAVDVWRGKAEEGAICRGDFCIPTGGKLAGTEDVMFFVCTNDPVVTRVKELAQADEGTVVAIVDLSGPFYAHSSIVSVDRVTPLAVRKFVESYLSGTVEKHPLKARS